MSEQYRYGFAVDVGTTSVAVALVDTRTAEKVLERSFLNPQSIHGADVLSRVSYGNEDPEHLVELRNMILGPIDRTARELCAEAGLDFDAIDRMVLSGNTIMEYLCAGLDPQMLFQGSRELMGKSATFTNPFGGPSVTLMPCISLYLGGDVSGGLLTSGFADSYENELFVDLGTNGEIILRYEDELYGASAAAGPALEGPDLPVGVTGSDLLDVIAFGLRDGAIDATGLLTNGAKEYQLTDELFISQQGIRDIQLAKGAISAAIALLLDTAGASHSEIETIYFAGAFGNHLSTETAKTIKLIDPSFDGETVFVGNTSLRGATTALLDTSILKRAAGFADNVHVLNLARDPRFQDTFLAALNF